MSSLILTESPDASTRISEPARSFPLALDPSNPRTWVPDSRTGLSWRHSTHGGWPEQPARVWSSDFHQAAHGILVDCPSPPCSSCWMLSCTYLPLAPDWLALVLPCHASCLRPSSGRRVPLRLAALGWVGLLCFLGRHVVWHRHCATKQGKPAGQGPLPSARVGIRWSNPRVLVLRGPSSHIPHALPRPHSQPSVWLHEARAAHRVRQGQRLAFDRRPACKSGPRTSPLPDPPPAPAATRPRGLAADGAPRPRTQVGRGCHIRVATRR